MPLVTGKIYFSEFYFISKNYLVLMGVPCEFQQSSENGVEI